MSALPEHDIFVVFPVNPLTLAKYRQAFAPIRAKAVCCEVQLGGGQRDMSIQ